MEDAWSTFIKELSGREVEHVMKDVRDGQFKKIVFLVGAGISVAAGLPVFRGDDAAPSLLTIDASNASIRRALYPFIEPIEPTDFHLLMDKTAYRIYTQNIDGLERDDGRTVWCHGKLLDGATCETCDKVTPWSIYKTKLEEMFQQCDCGGALRPNIILYGQETTFDYIQAVIDIIDADLVICAGTSLEVYPFASLLNEVRGEANSKLIIVEPNPTYNHVSQLGGCDRHLYNGDCQRFARLCLPSADSNEFPPPT